MTQINQEKLRQLKILWTDDDPAMPRYARRLLGDVCRELIVANSGFEALDLFDKHMPDIILMDVQMPDMTGLEVVEEIRKRDVMIPIIMVTGQEDKETLLKSVKLMIEDYIIKPPQVKDVMLALDRCVERLCSIRQLEISFQNGATYDTYAKQLKIGGQPLTLPRKERLLLEILIRNKGRIVTTEEIYWHLWRDDDVSEGAFKSVLSRLRSKIGKSSVRSHPGVGYSID